MQGGFVAWISTSKCSIVAIEDSSNMHFVSTLDYFFVKIHSRVPLVTDNKTVTYYNMIGFNFTSIGIL